MNQIRASLNVVRIDLGYFFRTKWLLLTLISLNLSDMLVAGLAYSRIMSIDYFVFYAPGVVVAGLFTASLDVGRRVHLGLTEGVTQYYLSLPLSIRALALSHLISAGMAGTTYSGILLLFASFFLPSFLNPGIFLIIGSMFVVSMGLGGVAAIINLVSGGGDRYWQFAEGIQSLFLGVSTVFYPLYAIKDVLPSPLLTVVRLNPLTQLVEMMRSSLPIEHLSLQPAELLASSLILFLVGFLCYSYIFTQVNVKGRV
jgi:ABC-type polysaccharide/polyol phosphate export permease